MRAVQWIDRIGAGFLGLVREIYHLLGLLYLSGKVLWIDRDLGQRPFVRQTLIQVHHTGVEALPLVILLGLATGAVSGLLPMVAAATPGGVESMAHLLSQVVMQHVTPATIGGLVIMRSVTAITADLGIMRVQRQIEAVEVMGLSPVGYLVTPRIVGGTLAYFGMSFFFQTTALLGAVVSAGLTQAIPPSVLVGTVLTAVHPPDILAFVLKVGLAGIGIFLVACCHGFSVGSAPAQVPWAVSRAALDAFLLLIVVHSAVSLGWWIHSGDPLTQLGGAL